MHETLEEELKRVRIKENSKKMREMVKNGDGDKISCTIYPNFEPGIRSHCKVEENREQTVNMLAHPPAILKREPNDNCQLDLKKQENELKKKLKTAEWAMSTAEHEKAQDAEVDELLNFMDNFDAKKYSEDLEVKTMMESLKARVTELKKEDNWKENWESRLKDKRKRREEEYLKEKANKLPDDNVSINGDASQLGIMGGSMGSRGDAKTVISDKTQGRLFTQQSLSSRSRTN